MSSFVNLLHLVICKNVPKKLVNVEGLECINASGINKPILTSLPSPYYFCATPSDSTVVHISFDCSRKMLTIGSR